MYRQQFCKILANFKQKCKLNNQLLQSHRAAKRFLNPTGAMRFGRNPCLMLASPEAPKMAM